MFTKENFEVMKVAASEKKRPVWSALRCVYFDPKFTVASDGCILLKIDAISEGEESFKPFMLSLDDVKLLAEKTKKDAKACVKKVDEQEGIVEFVFSSGAITCNIVKENFPDFQSILEKHKPKFRIAFDLLLLKSLCEAMISVYGKKKPCMCVFEFQGADDPVVLKGDDGVGAIGMIMPMRMDKELYEGEGR